MLRSAALLPAVVLLAGYQAGPPATEVFLASFSIANGKAAIGTPVNISSNPGYDNQPAFTPDGRAVLFTSVRGDQKPDPANSAATGSDIYRYDIGSRRISRVTSTPDSEYSPTIAPDGQHFSVVRVEGDGTQRLWRFALDGSAPALLLPDVQPVGYHAWADADTVALFVLGRPATLQIARLSTGKAEIVAKDIGRSIRTVPGGGISYVQREERGGATRLTVMLYSLETGRSRPLVDVMPGPRDPDLAWTPDGTLLLAHDGALYGWTRHQAAFSAVADLAALDLHDVTRMAVSPGGDAIALVASPSRARYVTCSAGAYAQEVTDGLARQVRVCDPDSEGEVRRKR